MFPCFEYQAHAATLCQRMKVICCVTGVSFVNVFVMSVFLPSRHYYNPRTRKDVFMFTPAHLLQFNTICKSK